MRREAGPGRNSHVRYCSSPDSCSTCTQEVQISQRLSLICPIYNNHLDVEAARDVGALLQEAAVLQQHAAVHRDAELLRGEEDVHEVDVLGRRVSGARHHQQPRTQLLRLLPGSLHPGDGADIEILDIHTETNYLNLLM